MPPCVFRFFCLAMLLLLAAGCAKQKQKLSQLSGKVTFNGKPVPAGYISFTPDSTKGNVGPVKLVQIKDGEYNTAQERDSGIFPGPNMIQIGYNGKPEADFPQGKQIFNPYELRETLPEGTSTKDFTVPPSAAAQLRITPTAGDQFPPPRVPANRR